MKVLSSSVRGKDLTFCSKKDVLRNLTQAAFSSDQLLESWKKMTGNNNVNDLLETINPYKNQDAWNITTYLTNTFKDKSFVDVIKDKSCSETMKSIFTNLEIAKESFHILKSYFLSHFTTLLKLDNAYERFKLKPDLKPDLEEFINGMDPGGI